MGTKIIMHGTPIHDYFSIIQPCDSIGGLDCSCVKIGIGETHTLQNPHTDESISAILICRRSIYTDSDSFYSLAYTIYGTEPSVLLPKLKVKYPGMIDELVEVWTFKRVK